MWELVNTDQWFTTHRLSVPKGWVVRTTSIKSFDLEHPVVALVFVPDDQHSWYIEGRTNEYNATPEKS